MSGDTSNFQRQRNIEQHVIDKDGLVWRIVRDGGMATRADYNGITSIGINVLEREHGPTTPVIDTTMRVEITRKIGAPDTCTVWFGDRVSFDGVDRSVLLQKGARDG